MLACVESAEVREVMDEVSLLNAVEAVDTDVDEGRKEFVPSVPDELYIVSPQYQVVTGVFNSEAQEAQ
jgi:hypothetical protein